MWVLAARACGGRVRFAWVLDPSSRLSWRLSRGGRNAARLAHCVDVATEAGYRSCPAPTRWVGGCDSNPFRLDGAGIATRLLAAAEDVEHIPEQAAPLSALCFISGPGPCSLITAREVVVRVWPALVIAVSVIAVSVMAVVHGASRLRGRTRVITIGMAVRPDLCVDNAIQFAPIEKDAPAFGALVDEHAAPLVGAHRATALEAGQGRAGLGLVHRIPSMEGMDGIGPSARADRRPMSFWISTTQNRAVDATRTTARSARLSASVERTRWAGGQ